MKMEVFYNYGMLLNDRFVIMSSPNCMAEALLLECRTSDQIAIVMSNIEGNRVILKLGDIKECFAISNIKICFILQEDKVSIGGKRYEALTFFPTCRGDEADGVLGRKSRSEFEIAFDFVVKHFRGVKLKKIENIEDINCYINGFKFKNSKILAAVNKYSINLVETVVRDSGSDKFGVQVNMCRWYNRTYSSYMHFLQKSSWCDKDFKIFLRCSDNLPKFFKEELSCESSKMLWNIVEGFLMFHTCNNAYAGCSKGTYLKCSNCRFVYYCSKQCQVEDWPRHKFICQGVRGKYMELELSRTVTQSYVMKQAFRNRGESLLTFKVFMQEIERALFTAFFSVIEHTNHFDEDLNFIFRTTNKKLWTNGLKSLQRKRYKRLKISSKKFESQMMSVFRTKSAFS